MRLSILIRPHKNDLNQEAAQAVSRILGHAPGNRVRATLFLAGGSTSRPVYELLARDYHRRLPWEQIVLYWRDERWVQPDDPLSNQHMAREALIDKLPIPPGNVLSIPTAETPEAAAERYDRLLKQPFAEIDSGPEGVRPTNGELTWWLDGTVASDLPRFFQSAGSPV